MLDQFSLAVNVSVFVVAAVVIGWVGTRLTGLADALADRTGLGEAVSGTIFLGLVTSLPEIAASVFAALEGRAALAIGNAIGGIAVQTMFLALADIVHRKANLEHAAASATNMVQTTLLLIMLTLVLLSFNGPEVSVWHVHPASILMLAVTAGGAWLIYRSKAAPMWRPTLTSATVNDVPNPAHRDLSLSGLVLQFLVAAAVVTVAGALVAHTTGNIADRTGMNETLAGALLAGVATSLPELVTTIAAVRRGALTLAVANIVGGNMIDVLVVVAADFAYMSGSLYHAEGVGAPEAFLTGLVILMNLVLLLGLLSRQRQGPANIGFESVLILLLYLAGFAVLAYGI